MYLGDVAVAVFYKTIALHNIGALQTHHRPGRQAEPFFGRHFHKIFPLDPEFLAEGYDAGAHAFIRTVLGGQFFHLAVFIIINDQFHGIENGHHAAGGFIQVFAEAEFQQAQVDEVLPLGDADAVAEIADGGGGVSLAAEGADGGHAGVVPSRNMSFVHQLQQAALAHHGIGHVEACELVLVRGEYLQFLDQPVVQLTVRYEFEGADGVGDVFDAVALPVCEVVHGVDAPFVAGAVMVRMLDAVEDGVSHEHVGMGHVDLRPQYFFTVLVFAGLHIGEELEVFLDGPAAVAVVFARFGGRSFQGRYFVGGRVVDIGKSFPDEFHRVFVKCIKIIGGVEFVGPFEAEPADIVLDAVYVFGVFGNGVGIVEAKVGLAAVFDAQSEIKADAFGMADMEVAVGFGRKAGKDAFVLAVLQVFFYDLLNEIEAFFFAHRNSVKGANLRYVS